MWLKSLIITGCVSFFKTWPYKVNYDLNTIHKLKHIPACSTCTYIYKLLTCMPVHKHSCDQQSNDERIPRKKTEFQKIYLNDLLTHYKTVVGRSSGRKAGCYFLKHSKAGCRALSGAWVKMWVTVCRWENGHEGFCKRASTRCIIGLFISQVYVDNTETHAAAEFESWTGDIQTCQNAELLCVKWSKRKHLWNEVRFLCFPD